MFTLFQLFELQYSWLCSTFWIIKNNINNNTLKNPILILHFYNKIKIGFLYKLRFSYKNFYFIGLFFYLTEL